MKYVYATFNWGLGLFFLIGGITGLFMSPLAGVLLILMSLLLLPPIRKFVYSKTNKKLHFAARFALLVVMWVGVSYFSYQDGYGKPPSSTAKTADPNGPVYNCGPGQWQRTPCK